MKPLWPLSLFVLALSTCQAVILAQSGVLREGARPPSVASPPSDPFTSAEGKFTIALPSRTSGNHPIRIQGTGDTITGESFEWQTAEGSFTVSYMDMPALLSGSVAAGLGLDRYCEQTLAQVRRSNGKVISEQNLLLSGHPGREIKADMLGYLYTFRAFMTGRRLYQLMVATAKDHAGDVAITDKVLDSFKLTPDEAPAR
jgi:hypothetical protein